MAKHSITAIFDTRADAEKAVAQLQASGVPAADITSLPAAGESGAYADLDEAKTKGFWASLEDLFGGTDDHSTYAEGIRRGGNMVSVRAEDADVDRVVDILEKHGSVDLDEREASWRNEGWTGGAMARDRGLAMDDPGMTAMGGGRGEASGTGAAALATGALGAGAMGMAGRDRAVESRPVVDRAVEARPVVDRAVEGWTAAAPATGLTGKARDAAEDVVQVVEERLDVGKRTVNRGRVRVHTSVVSREVSENVTLHGETVQVDRRPVDRPISAAALDADPFRERTIEMEQYDEEAVVSKTAHVVEEIGLRKDATDRTETVRDTVRSTKVDIEDGRGTAGGAAARAADEIRGGLEVVGSDGGHVGTVDGMDGGRIKLKKLDATAGGEHHYLARDMVRSVADKVVLAMTADEAKRRWTTV